MTPAAGTSGGGTSGGGTGGGGTSSGPEPMLSEYAACAQEEHIGGFTVTLAEEFTSVGGHVFDGVTPNLIREVVAVDGDCELTRAYPFVCDPMCESGQSCSAEEVCVRTPQPIDFGTVSILGMKDEVLMMPSRATGRYSRSGSLTHPGFDEGALLTLEVPAAGTYPAQSITAQGVAPLEIDPNIVVDSGQPVDLSWTAAPASSSTRIYLVLNVNNHGTTSANIRCTVDDTGSFSIPEPLVTQLTTIGVSGFPTLSASRRSVNTAVLEPGCMDFVVTTTLDLDVQIAGLTSCSGDADCTPPETCGPTLACE